MKAGKVTNRAGQKRPRARAAGRVAQEKTAGALDADAVVVPFSTPAMGATSGQQPQSAAPAGPLVTLEGDCTARHADRLKAVLLGQLEVPERVSLDITAIERIDTVSLQLLTAFVRDRSQGGRQIAWTGHNDIFSHAARLLGLTAALSAADVA